ncbi:AMP-binding protein [Diaphorobacter sp. HDW4A]|uniref:AMP-binding protein n=1 Tax=Diaphorobacter sp. HDW4A TaxID=2714924 RepID=UPI00140CADE7|nr:AMP-binding protein [Diaphorobacter sp. HDW4A]QIL81347.1 AMP-binding protein [Diaphorobacter sp. HDW4A]
MTIHASPQNLRELIDARAAGRGSASFMLNAQNDASLSFAQLKAETDKLRSNLAQAGLAPGDKVSVYLPNGPLPAILLLGIMASGLVVNPVNLLSQPSQLLHVLRHSDTRLVFTCREYLPPLEQALAQIERRIAIVLCDPESMHVPWVPELSADGAANADADSDSLATHAISSDEPALIMYTSGTTGVPKGVLLSHANLLANAAATTEAHQLNASDRVMVSLPLYHINALVVALITPLFHGGSLVMAPKFSAKTFWADVCRFECTWINVVPTIIAYLLNDEADNESNNDGARDLSRLRFCRSASAALAPEHHRAFEARFGLGIIETMGLTETAAPSFSNPLDANARRVGSVGQPTGALAAIMDIDGRFLPAGERGEIVLQGPNVMLGYYKDPSRTKDAFTSDGWLRTGDIGYQDADGFFYVTGRSKELIIKGGENIAPREIDEAVLKHPKVLDAAAVGVPHPEYGQEIAVYLVMRDGAEFDAADLRRHCLVELGNYKCPSRFVQMDELPRGPSGKLQRLKLLEQPA